MCVWRDCVGGCGFTFLSFPLLPSHTPPTWIIFLRASVWKFPLTARCGCIATAPTVCRRIPFVWVKWVLLHTQPRRHDFQWYLFFPFSIHHYINLFLHKTSRGFFIFPFFLLVCRRRCHCCCLYNSYHLLICICKTWIIVQVLTQMREGEAFLEWI